MELENDEVVLEICYTLSQVKRFERLYDVVDWMLIDDEDDDDFKIITIMLGKMKLK